MHIELLNNLKQQFEQEEDFLLKMEIQSEIDDMEIKLGIKNPSKPLDSPYLCEGCSA